MAEKMGEATAAVRVVVRVAGTVVETEGAVTTAVAEKAAETARCRTRHRAWQAHHSSLQPEACTHGVQTHTQMRHAH